MKSRTITFRLRELFSFLSFSSFCLFGAETRIPAQASSMGKVKVWLKRTFLVVIVLIAIIGLLLLGLTLFSHGHFHKDEEIEDMIYGLHLMYAIAVVSVVLAVIGGLGVCKEKKWPLIVFVVGMILSSLFLLGIEILTLALQPQLERELKVQFLHMLPLSNASELITDGLREVQSELQCCGLAEGYMDWDDNIPDSCLCADGSINPCVAAPRNSRLFEGNVDDEPIMIYSESCIPYIMENVAGFIKTAVGIMMGVTLLLVLSVVLGIIILCRLDRKVDTPPVAYSSEAKAGNYTTLAETTEET